MADDASSPIIAAASPVDTEQTRREEVQVSDINANVDTNGTDSAAESSADEVAKDAPTKSMIICFLCGNHFTAFKIFTTNIKYFYA